MNKFNFNNYISTFKSDIMDSAIWRFIMRHQITLAIVQSLVLSIITAGVSLSVSYNFMSMTSISQLPLSLVLLILEFQEKSRMLKLTSKLILILAIVLVLCNSTISMRAAAYFSIAQSNCNRACAEMKKTDESYVKTCKNLTCSSFDFNEYWIPIYYQLNLIILSLFSVFSTTFMIILYSNRNETWYKKI